MKGDGTERVPAPRTPSTLAQSQISQFHTPTFAHHKYKTHKCPPKYAYTASKTQIDAWVNTYATNIQHTPASTYHTALNTHIYIHTLKYTSQVHTLSHPNIHMPGTCVHIHTYTPKYIASQHMNAQLPNTPGVRRSRALRIVVPGSVPGPQMFWNLQMSSCSGEPL